MPSEKLIDNNTDKLIAVWQKHEKNILTEIASVTGLKWRESHINAYVTAGVGWFSAPLTLSVDTNTNFLLHTLIHELIHRILNENENWPKLEKQYNQLLADFPDEETNTASHIPIHAIHKHIYLKYFSKKDVDKEIGFMKKNDPAYYRSWKHVDEIGFDNIIREYINNKYPGLKNKPR